MGESLKEALSLFDEGIAAATAGCERLGPSRHQGHDPGQGEFGQGSAKILCSEIELDVGIAVRVTLCGGWRARRRVGIRLLIRRRRAPSRFGQGVQQPLKPVNLCAQFLQVVIVADGIERRGISAFSQDRSAASPPLSTNASRVWHAPLPDAAFWFPSFDARRARH